ncbi:MAG: hypothetical protein N2315_03470 [Thermanaerothrix sp.]|nr:hypothetical protein [Thermanaerothrix sp.]
MKFFVGLKRYVAPFASAALCTILLALPAASGEMPDPMNGRYQLPGGLAVRLLDGKCVSGDLKVQLVDARPLDPLGLGWAALLKVASGDHTEWFIASTGDAPFEPMPLEDRHWIKLSASGVPYLPRVVHVLNLDGTELRFRVEKGRLVPLSDDWEMPVVKKPVIYLYPPVKTFVVLEPKPKGEVVECDPPLGPWRVYASPDGSLSTGGHSLYYECSLRDAVRTESAGWVVRANGLEGGLRRVGSALGLEGRELDEFVAYWTPTLRQKGVDVAARPFDPVFLRENMPLEVNPSPETEIRALVAFSPWDGGVLDEPKVKVPARRGFTLVEWGGVWLPEP